MERIVYKSKFKKVISCMIMVTLLFEIIMPSIVFADNENKFDIKITTQIKNALNPDIIEYIEGDSQVKSKIENYAGLLKFLWEKEFTDFIPNNVNTIEKGQEDALYIDIVANILYANASNNVYRSESSDGKTYFVISTTDRKIVYNVFNTYFGTTVAADVSGVQAEANKTIKDNNYKYRFFEVKKIKPNNNEEDRVKAYDDEQINKIINWVTDKYEYMNSDVIKNQLMTDPSKIKAEFDSEGNVSKVTIDEELLKGWEASYDFLPDETDPDIGGLLLSPIFWLFNFITDAIISNLGRIMTGDGLSPISGFGVLKTTPPELGYEKTATYEVNSNTFLLNSYQYPNIKYTPEEIFSGKIDLLSIDFISGEGNDNEDWLDIRKVVSQWYKVLRMFAIIGLLSVLIYTGIRIMISANSKDKAKYKEWIVNWFVAVAILFTMHYIMSFIISVIGEINELLSQATQGIEVKLVNKNGSVDNTFVTNLMGLVRFMIQSENFYIKVGYEVLYIALITYTVKFTIMYLKRVLNMAFLTLIAPIVALTYPIDKLNDGSAQGFEMWLKEYIFNALLQPMHYILYYVLVGSAVSVAASNPIFGIVVLMFMTEAERLLKKIFGFDKAGGGTVGGMSGALAAATIASSVKDIARMSKSSKGKSDNSLPKGEEGDGGVPATRDSSSMSSFDDSEQETGGQETGGQIADGEDDDEIEAWDPLTYHTMQENSGQGAEGQGTEGQGAEEQSTEEDDDGIEAWDPLTYHTMRENNEQNTYATGRRINSASTSQPTQTSQSSQVLQASRAQSIRDMAKRIKKSRKYKGVTNVAKTLAKPIWDVEKGPAYNGKRLVRNVARGALGVGIGITAAAVQAGISITDGKYNPMEGVATFTAGYAGAGKMFSGVENIGKLYREGANAGNKEEQMKRIKAEYGDRDDVIRYNKKNYAGREKEMMQRQRDNWLEYGYYNPKDMKSGIKYADSYIKNKYGDNFKNLSESEQKRIIKEADKRAVQTMSFRKKLESQNQIGTLIDMEKRKKYIEEMVRREAPKNATNAEKERIRRRYTNAFNAVIEYDDAQ